GNPMLLLLATVLILFGCSTDGSRDSQHGGKSETEESSLYCCTMREYCLACDCTAAETRIFESEVETACKQLLDSAAYRCEAGDETTALAQCVNAPNTPSNPTAPASPCDGDETQGDDCQESGVDDNTATA